MARTQEEFLNIILRAQCCVADLAYKGLKEEMFLKPDRGSNYKKVRYMQALIGILNRYYDVVYNLLDTPCVSDDEIEYIIQETYAICDACGCCTDASSITQDIAAPVSSPSGSGQSTPIGNIP
jgi:hypothetical protein